MSLHEVTGKWYHFNDLWPGFQGHDIFWSRISENRRVFKCYCTRWKIPNI